MNSLCNCQEGSKTMQCEEFEESDYAFSIHFGKIIIGSNGKRLLISKFNPKSPII